ncbi:MAG: LysR family transcriptional regulator [Ferrimicrobium sp.]
MELRQLEYFVAVAEEASFTKAAARVHVAQPGVSAQIRRLERELGEILFDRSDRTVQLTAAGEVVLPYARTALSAVENARLALDELVGLVRGRVTVGMITSCASVEFTGLLAGFHRNYPDVEIVLSEDTSDRLIDGIIKGRFDLAWIGLAGPRPAGITSRVVADEALVAAVSHSHPLASKSSIRLIDLRDHPLISLPRGTGLRTCLDAGCAHLGFVPHVALEASALGLVAQLAQQDLGVAILPESVATNNPELHPLTISRPTLRSRIELVWRADGGASPAARALVHHAETLLHASAERSPSV